MKKVLGIIAEYNPFHNGHLYHINEAKRKSGADICVCVMSGNFVQRGEPAIVDKWKRTLMALENGIDLVIELPVVYSISSAEGFAKGAIKILNDLGFVTDIAFGAECENLKLLQKIAVVISEESEEYKLYLKESLKEGNSYVLSRAYAVNKVLNNEECLTVMHESNNILAIEYLKALNSFESDINPILIKRNLSKYNDVMISNDFASATAIRSCIKKDEIELIKNVIPKNCSNILFDAISKKDCVIDLKELEQAIIYSIRKMSLEELKQIPDVTEGLEYKIKKEASETNDINHLIANVKSKRYTETRIKRILLCCLLEIKKSDMEEACKNKSYIRVLGVTKNGEQLLPIISKENDLIISVKQFMDKNKNVNLLDKDLLATDMYFLANKYNGKTNLDYITEMVKA